MKLPNSHLALVESQKITEYLLNPAHPDNGGKAAFFAALGFTRDEWPALAAAFRGLCETAEVTESLEFAHGHKYVLDGRLGSLDGRMAVVRTVWIVDRGTEMPRLVTAYPHEE